MQEEALENLKQYRELGENRALIVSATGSGKTITSLLDVNEVNPKKVLFLVHRWQIATKAKETYEAYQTNGKSCGLIGNGIFDADCDYVFAMTQTMCKDDVLAKFHPEEFDYIIFDECHRLGSPTSQKIVKYFKPAFFLGMTATPMRNDGYDIFAFFNYNLACDISLQDAIKEDLVCPFHYYGVSEFRTEDGLINENSDFSLLVSDERVNHVINKIQLYGYYGDKVKGLIFVSRVAEAKELSRKFNENGFRTTSITGEDSQEFRQQAIDKLESNDPDAYDYLFVVDAFNEGIDIREINQVVMLRPTESAIIFIQQLGRGLRKTFNKPYLVVLDFVGNYDNNYLIPVALSGKLDGRKSQIRKTIKTINSTIHGSTTVEFEKVIEDKIYESIDNIDFSSVKFIKEAYRSLKAKMGKIPTLIDIAKYGDISPLMIFNKFASYHEFKVKQDAHDYTVRFNKLEEQYLKLISRKYASGKRKYELLALKEIISKGFVNLNDIISDYPGNKEQLFENISNQFDGSFFVGNDREYKEIPVGHLNEGLIVIDERLKNILSREEFNRQINEAIELGLYYYHNEFSNTYKDTSFVLNELYSYPEVCQLLNFDEQQTAQNIGGYTYNRRTNTLPIFINYHKSEDIVDTIKYEDYFESRNILHWMSKNGRKLSSPEIQAIMKAKENGLKIYLFIRKKAKKIILANGEQRDVEGRNDFYFLGEMNSTHKFDQVFITNDKSVVSTSFSLDVPVRNDIYDYLIKNE